jgi:hypothetical protein
MHRHTLLLVNVWYVALLCLLHNDLQTSCKKGLLGFACLFLSAAKNAYATILTYWDAVWILFFDAGSLGLALLYTGKPSKD